MEAEMIPAAIPWIVWAAALAGLLLGLLVATILAFALSATRAQLREAQMRNELFSRCMQRANAIWQKEHPGEARFPDGAALFAWVAVKLNVDADIGEEYRENPRA